MKASDFISLGSTLVAIAALFLTAYLARINLESARRNAHDGRVWERKVDVLLDFLEWLEDDATDGTPKSSSTDDAAHAPHIPTRLYSRLTAFLPEFDQPVAKMRLAVGKWRRQGLLFEREEVAYADLQSAEQVASYQLEVMRTLVRNEVRLAPHTASPLRGHMLERLRQPRAVQPTSSG